MDKIVNVSRSLILFYDFKIMKLAQSPCEDLPDQLLFVFLKVVRVTHRRVIFKGYFTQLKQKVSFLSLKLSLLHWHTSHQRQKQAK